jgi:hypothetical protein
MAKHLAEGRAFPLFFYGQHYMLGVQAWMAAPFFLVGAPTILWLRMPLLLVNCAFVIMLIVLLTKEGRLRPAAGFVAALPLIMPAPVVSSDLYETLGASVEPFLYILLLWILRRRPVAFGIVLAIGFFHREFTIFAVPALAVVMLADRTLFTRATAERVLTMALTIAGVLIVLEFLKGTVDVYGPPTGVHENGPLGLQLESLASRMCFEPAELMKRVRSLFADCLPDLLGARTFPLALLNVSSTVSAGSSAVGWMLSAAGVAVAVRMLTLPRQRVAAVPPFVAYLFIVGLEAFVVYPLSCQIVPGHPGILRYALLGLLLPVAATAWYLDAETVPLLKGLALGVILVWGGMNLVDNARVVSEYRRRPPVNEFRQLADYLVASDIRYARAGYWDAYVVDFLTREQVIVASDGKVRIRIYEQPPDPRTRPARIERAPCSAGVKIADSWCVIRAE